MTIKGIDCLALGSKLWPIADTIKIVPHDWAIGCFDSTFGDARHNLGALYDGGFRTFRVHLWWDDSHKIVPLQTVRMRARAYEQFVQRHPGTTLYLSPSCEYQRVTPLTIKSIISALKTNAPSCIPVLAPLPGSPVIPGVIVEKHGDTSTKPGQFVSLDGNDMRDTSMDIWSAKNKDAAIAFAWMVSCNLSLRGGPKLPRSMRKNPPTRSELQLMVDVMNSYF